MQVSTHFTEAMASGRKALATVLALGAITSSTTGQNWCAADYLVQPTPEAGAFTGVGIALDGDRLVMGSAFSGGSVLEAGRAFVFDRTASGWNMTQELVPSVSFDLDQFGFSIDLDGDRAVVGAPALGLSSHVFVFELQAGTWVETAAIPLTSWAGQEVVLDGDRFVTAQTDHVRVFELQGGSWVETAFIDQFSSHGMVKESVDLEGDRLVLAGGTFGTRVYELQAGTWTLVATIPHPLAGFPGTTNLSLSGDRLAVGNYLANRAYLFELQGGTWTFVDELSGSQTTGNGEFGQGLSLEGDLLAVTARANSQVYLFEWQGGSWVETVFFDWSDNTTAPNVVLGFPVECDLDGDRVAFGWFGSLVDGVGPSAGAVQIMEDMGSAPASSSFRNGLGLNPADFDSLSAPVHGGVWEASISLVPTVGSSTLATSIAFSLAGPDVGTPFGPYEIFVLPPVIFATSLGGSYSIPVPCDIGLVGAPLATQGIRLEDTGSGLVFVLLNAQDLVLGV